MSHTYNVSIELPDNINEKGFLESLSRRPTKRVVFEMKDGRNQAFDIIDADIEITDEGKLIHKLIIGKIK